MINIKDYVLNLQKHVNIDSLNILNLDNRIKAASLLTFSFVSLFSYRKEIQAQFLRLISPSISSFLKNKEHLPNSLNKQEIEQALIANSNPKQKNTSFTIDKTHTPEEWLKTLPTLSDGQLVEAAKRVLPSAEPYLKKTNEEKFHGFLRNIATGINRIIKGIDEGISGTKIIKEIKGSPQGYAGILVNGMIFVLYQKIVPFLPSISFVEEASSVSKKQKFRATENPVATRSVEAAKQSFSNFISSFSLSHLALGTMVFLTCYRLMQRELPRGVRNLCSDLQNRKIPFRGLDFYASWNAESSYKTLCENILTFFFATSTEQKKAILLTSPTQSHEPVESLAHTLAEIAFCGRSDTLKEPFEVLSIDLQTLFNSCSNDPDIFEKKWNEILEYKKGNTVLYLTKFAPLYSQITGSEAKDQKNQAKRGSKFSNNPSPMPICLGHILESIKDGNARCVIAVSEKEKQILLGSEDKEYFHPMSVYRMPLTAAKNLLTQLYSTLDRWETPRLTEDTIDQLMEVIENHHMEHELPYSLLSMADQCTRAATVEQNKKLLAAPPKIKEQWNTIKKEEGRRLDEVRVLKEDLFEQIAKLTRENREDSRLPELAKQLLVVEHVIIPLLYTEIEEKRAEILEIPSHIDQEEVFTLVQKQHKRLFHAAGPKEIAGWEALPNRLLEQFSDRKEPIETICQVLKTRRIAYDGSNKPVSILLYGPPGTGKSYLAKTIAAEACKIYNIEDDPDPSKEKNVLRIYLSQVSWKTGTASFLTEIQSFIKKNNTGFVILEEMDKIPPEALDKFLQLLDDTPLTKKSGKTPIHKGNVTFIFTSNECMEELSEINNDLNPQTQFHQDQELLKKKWAVESNKSTSALLSRLDAVIPYRTLKAESTQDYAEKFLEQQKRVWNQHGITLEFDPSVVNYYSTEKNNRQLQQKIKSSLCGLLENRLNEFKNKKVKISLEGETLVAKEVIVV